MKEYIKINLKNIHNICFEGFGTSLSWFANAIGNSSNNEIKDHLCNILFDQNNVNSLQLSIVRYNIGGGASINESLRLRNGGNIPGYNNKENWNDIDYGQRYFLKKAKELGVHIFEAFSNSPPPEMTRSGMVQGHKYRCINNLCLDKIDDFADYLINVTLYLRKNDMIPFNTISPMNEPSGPGWIIGSGQEGCFYDYKIRKKVLKVLYNKLKNNLKIKISACEENNMLQGLIGIIMNPFIWKYVDQFNIHRYSVSDSLKINTFNIEDSNILRRIIYWMMYKVLKKKIWMSEWGMGNMNNNVEMLFNFSNSLIDDFNYLKPSAWIYWQVIEDLSWNGWGCVQVSFDKPSLDNIIYTVQFTTFQHFTHFIKPGSYFLKLHKPKNKIIKWIGCIDKNNKISLIILSKNIVNIDIIFPYVIYDVKIMCSYGLPDKNIKVEHNHINKIQTIFLKPMSLTSMSFYIK